MNMVLAKNVRAFRETKHWTQQHLADAAGIQLRTIQRVEKGDGASLDTLGALSNAFDVSIDVLQTDIEAAIQQIQREYESLRKTHDIVAVSPVASSRDLDLIGDSQASIVECKSDDDAARDAFAALGSNLRDIIDIWNDVDPSHQREWVKEAFEQVQELNGLGVVVCIGKGPSVISTPTGPITFNTVYVVAWPKGQEKAFIAVEKRVGLG